MLKIIDGGGVTPLDFDRYYILETYDGRDSLGFTLPLEHPQYPLIAEEMPVLAVGVTVQGVQHPASQIGAPRPGVVQQEREICRRLHKNLHKRHRACLSKAGKTGSA